MEIILLLTRASQLRLLFLKCIKSIEVKRSMNTISRPWSVQGDINFSEDSSIEKFDKLQSEH
eukprot:2224781-Ditylum_brightwellii.AAC.1